MKACDPLDIFILYEDNNNCKIVLSASHDGANGSTRERALRELELEKERGKRKGTRWKPLLWDPSFRASLGAAALHHPRP